MNLNASIENGLEGIKVMDAVNKLEFRQSKKKFFDKPLYCRVLKNLTPEKIESPPATPNEFSGRKPRKDLNPELLQENSASEKKQGLLVSKTGDSANQVETRLMKRK